MGPCERKLEGSLKSLGISEERYFGKDKFVGNRLHKAYVSVQKDDKTIVSCFSEYPDLKEKFWKLWKNISNIDKLFSLPDPTIEENEKMARECEKFCEIFPVQFPKKNITRKMAELSLVLPKFIRSSPGLL